MKKAQIKSFETIAIIFIFIILVGLGFIFYARIQKSTFKTETSELKSSQAIQIAKRVLTLPEVQCIESESTDCIDIYKLEKAKDTISSNYLYYLNILGYSNITIKKIYPLYSGEKDIINIYSNPKENYNQQTSIQTPISIFDPITKTNVFGVLLITIYQ